MPIGFDGYYRRPTSDDWYYERLSLNSHIHREAKTTPARKPDVEPTIVGPLELKMKTISEITTEATTRTVVRKIRRTAIKAITKAAGNNSHAQQAATFLHTDLGEAALSVVLGSLPMLRPDLMRCTCTVVTRGGDDDDDAVSCACAGRCRAAQIKKYCDELRVQGAEFATEKLGSYLDPFIDEVIKVIPELSPTPSAKLPAKP